MTKTKNNIWFAYTMEIPVIFQSDLTGKPFPNCVQCEKELLCSGVEYLVEKAIQSYPGSSVRATIFEYAICYNCYFKMQDELSKESLEKMDLFFEQQVKTDWWERMRKLIRKKPQTADPWLESCIITGNRRDEVEEYQIFGAFEGEEMLLSIMPYMICGEGMDLLIEQLSGKTLDELNGFKDRLVSPAPVLAELVNQPHLVI